MPRIRGSGLLCIGVGCACFARAMLVLVLAYGMVGGIAAVKRAALLASLPPAPKPIRAVTGGAARFFSGRAPGLDRIAAAIDAAESNYGTNPRMMRADFEGPQGPMQISAIAAADIGGGNRFDLRENLVLGRAYLAYMQRRYGNWADAIAAYNWGPGHMDAWLHEGRHTDRLPAEVARYTGQVLLASARPSGQLPDPDVKASSLARHRSAPSPKIRMTPPARRAYSRRRREYKKDAFVRSPDLSLRGRRTLHYRVADNERSRFILAHAQHVPGYGLRRSRNVATLQSRDGQSRNGRRR